MQLSAILNFNQIEFPTANHEGMNVTLRTYQV